MKIRLTHVLVAITVILLTTTLMLVSFIRARSAADGIMLPILDEWNYYRAKFYPVMLRHDLTTHVDGPSWWIFYDARNAMVSGPLAVKVDLFGNVIGTNPSNLRDKIAEKKVGRSYRTK